MRVFLRQLLIPLNRADFCLSSMNYNRLSKKKKPRGETLSGFNYFNNKMYTLELHVAMMVMVKLIKTTCSDTYCSRGWYTQRTKNSRLARMKNQKGISLLIITSIFLTRLSLIHKKLVQMYVNYHQSRLELNTQGKFSNESKCLKF